MYVYLDSIFCVDLEKYQPDVVLIDFAVNDYGHPKLMDALIRKILIMPSQPIVLLVNLWVHANCPTPRYLLHSFYYQIPMLNVCPAVTLCYGKDHLPKHIYEQYSKTDGVHPWGNKGVYFLGTLLYAWWKKLDTVATYDVSLDFDGKYITHRHSYDESFRSSSSSSRSMSMGTETDSQSLLSQLPAPLYAAHPIGLCTRCDALAGDADNVLTPVRPPKGFRRVVRWKIGYGGFNPNAADVVAATGTAASNSSSITTNKGAVKSFRKSWQSDIPGSEISFRFYGTTVKIAIWQRRDGMGVLHAYVDGDKSHIAKASGFFKGYTWAMEKNNTGRSEIIPLFEGLKDTEHELTLVISEEPANVWVKGHLVQVFALLSASDNLNCKNLTLNGL